MQKKIVRPEVYDLIYKIVEAMVTNYSVTIQRACKSVGQFLFFLNNRPS